MSSRGGRRVYTTTTTAITTSKTANDHEFIAEDRYSSKRNHNYREQDKAKVHPRSGANTLPHIMRQPRLLALQKVDRPDHPALVHRQTFAPASQRLSLQKAAYQSCRINRWTRLRKRRNRLWLSRLILIRLVVPLLVVRLHDNSIA